MSAIMEIPNSLQEIKEKEEAMEFMARLKTMTETEKQQLKGIMIGIALSKQEKNQ